MGKDLLYTFLSQHVTEPPDSQRNFLVVDQKTETSTIEKAFQNFTQERKDIGILLINQHVRYHFWLHLDSKAHHEHTTMFAEYRIGHANVQSADC